MSFLRDLIDSTFPVAFAEEPEQNHEETEDASEETPEESDDAEDDDEDDDEDEDEDDEDELKDPLDELREECENTSACQENLHHYHKCVERVTKEQEEEDYHSKAYKEDCVEEFFHLQHCINDCVAPKLFYKLK